MGGGGLIPLCYWTGGCSGILGALLIGCWYSSCCSSSLWWKEGGGGFTDLFTGGGILFYCWWTGGGGIRFYWMTGGGGVLELYETLGGAFLNSCEDCGIWENDYLCSPVKLCWVGGGGGTFFPFPGGITPFLSYCYKDVWL